MQVRVTFLDNGCTVDHTDLWYNQAEGTEVFQTPEVWVITKGDRLDLGPNEGAIVGICSTQVEACEYLRRLAQTLTTDFYLQKNADYCRVPGTCYVYRAFKVPELTGLLDSINSSPIAV